MKSGNQNHLLKSWHKYSGLPGKTVQLEAGSNVWSGTLRELNFDEIVLDVDGKLSTFQPQTVTRLRLM